MRGRYRSERGQVIVLGAVMIPVLLLLAALVVDVGNWYTHKRQLQNRADAAAFAAAVEYGKNWKACVQTADPTLKASTAQEIANAARQYAADPDAADYNKPATLPAGQPPASVYNSEIANQAQVRRRDQLDELRRQHRLLRRRARRRTSATRATSTRPATASLRPGTGRT